MSALTERGHRIACRDLYASGFVALERNALNVNTT